MPESGVGGEAESGASRRADVAAAAACAAVGVLLAVLPHLLWWPRLGEPAWIADYDDLKCYLTAAGQAYRSHPTYLTDPILGGVEPSILPPLQLVPGILAARALGLGPLGINLAWRAWAGLSIALGLYALARLHLRRPWPAAALATLLVADLGLVAGWPILKHYWVFADVAARGNGRYFLFSPIVYPHWRLITPALSLGYLLLHLWCLARALERPTCGRVVAAGLAFGVLFYDYFYFWTAAGLALLAGAAVDAGRRWVHVHVGWIGTLAGLPTVVAHAILARSASPDWFLRADKFLPIGHLAELSFPPKYLVPLALGLAWVLARRRDLLHLWLLAASGLALRNHQLLTGLQIENWHWDYVTGIVAAALLALLVAGAVLGRPARLTRRGAAALAAVCVAQVGTGLWLRAAEGTRTAFSRQILDDYRRFRDQRRAGALPRLEPEAVVAGDRVFVDFAMVCDGARPLDHGPATTSPRIGDADWDRRTALNGYLRGLDRAAFEAEQRDLIRSHDVRRGGHGVFGPWVRDPSRREARIAGRLAAFDAVAADPEAALRAFDVRYLALPAGAAPRRLGPGWARHAGPTWDLWAYREPGRSPPPSWAGPVSASRPGRPRRIIGPGPPTPTETPRP